MALYKFSYTCCACTLHYKPTHMEDIPQHMLKDKDVHRLGDGYISPDKEREGDRGDMIHRFLCKYGYTQAALYKAQGKIQVLPNMRLRPRVHMAIQICLLSIELNPCFPIIK